MCCAYCLLLSAIFTVRLPRSSLRPPLICGSPVGQLSCFLWQYNLTRRQLLAAVDFRFSLQSQFLPCFVAVIAQTAHLHVWVSAFVSFTLGRRNDDGLKWGAGRDELSSFSEHGRRILIVGCTFSSVAKKWGRSCLILEEMALIRNWFCLI